MSVGTKMGTGGSGGVLEDLLNMHVHLPEHGRSYSAAVSHILQLKSVGGNLGGEL